MPTPEQTRKNRIQELLEWAQAQKEEFQIVDPIFRKARELYPTVSKETARSYGGAVLRILRRNKRKEQ